MHGLISDKLPNIIPDKVLNQLLYQANKYGTFKWHKNACAQLEVKSDIDSQIVLPKARHNIEHPLNEVL